MLLSDNTGGGAVMLRPIWFQCAGVWISNGLPPVYMHSLGYVYSVPTCKKIQFVSDLLRQGVSVFGTAAACYF